MRHEHTVLFVDDEVNILKALQRLLRTEDMNVLCASRAPEALDLLEKHPTQVVVTDQRMPEMSGVDFLAHVRERQPDIVRMMLTGYTEMKVAVDAINRGEIYRLITKPWNDDELRATLRQAFDHADLKAEIKRLNQVTREQNFKLQDMNRNLEGKVRDRTKQLAEKHQLARCAWERRRVLVGTRVVGDVFQKSPQRGSLHARADPSTVATAAANAAVSTTCKRSRSAVRTASMKSSVRGGAAERCTC